MKFARKSDVLINIRITILTFLFLMTEFIFSGELMAEKKTDFNPDKRVTKQNTTVTFIELGSVKCIPCKMMQPVMDAIEKEYSGKVKVLFHDVWTPAGKPFGKKYGIKGIPTQIFLDKNGIEFYRHTGFLPKNQIVNILEKHGVKK